MVSNSISCQSKRQNGSSKLWRNYSKILKSLNVWFTVIRKKTLKSLLNKWPTKTLSFHSCTVVRNNKKETRSCTNSEPLQQGFSSPLISLLEVLMYNKSNLSSIMICPARCKLIFIESVGQVDSVEKELLSILWLLMMQDIFQVLKSILTLKSMNYQWMWLIY